MIESAAKERNEDSTSSVCAPNFGRGQSRIIRTLEAPSGIGVSISSAGPNVRRGSDPVVYRRAGERYFRRNPAPARTRVGEEPVSARQSHSNSMVESTAVDPLLSFVPTAGIGC